MAIHQTKQQSDLERRLKILRQQLYGREQELSIKHQESGKEETATLSHNTKYLIPNTDVVYLRHDLLKISLLASVALGAQIILFYLLKSNVLQLGLL